jgi:hypothetical protein
MIRRKFQRKSNDLLAKWKEKYQSKENERICEYRNYEEIQNENKVEIKELKEENEILSQLIANKTQKNNKRYLRQVFNSKNSENIDETNLFQRVDLLKANDLIAGNFFHEIDKLNLVFYERKEIEKNIKFLSYVKTSLIKEIKLIKKDKKGDSVESQIRENQNYHEKIKIKYEISCHANKILNKILIEFNENNKQIEREIDLIKNYFPLKIEKINSLKVELKENIQKCGQIKLKVDKLEKDLIERKHKREEYATVIQHELEDAKTIKIDHSKIKLENPDKSLRNEELLMNEATENENFRKEEFKLKFLNHFYENDLKLKSLTTSIKHDDNDENEMSNLNEKMNYFVDLVNGLFAQKCSLENELEQVKNEYFKFLCLNKNLDEKGSEMIEAFNNENLVLNNLIFNISYNNDNKTRFFSEILISIAGLCSKMMNFKTLNQKKFSKAQNELQIVNKFNTDEKVFAKTPEDLLNQLDEIINISQFLNENKNEQSNIEVHYYVNEINRLVNFMQNSYSVVLQEEDSKSNDFSNQEMNTLDASNEYISRQKIKLRSKDLLNRQLKSKKKEKMFATLERLNE